MATVPFIPVREVIVYCPNSGIWNAMTPALKQRYFLCYWSDERIRRHVAMLHAFGFNALQVSVVGQMARNAGTTLEQWEHRVNVMVDAGRALGMSITQFVWGNAVSSVDAKAADPHPIYDWHQADGRAALQREWDRSARVIAAKVDRLVTHWCDPGGATPGCPDCGIHTAVQMHNAIMTAFRRVNPTIEGFFSNWMLYPGNKSYGHGWPGYDGVKSIVDDPQFDAASGVAIGIMNCGSDGIRQDRFGLLNPDDLRAISRNGRQAAVWAWYTTDMEIQPAIHVHTQLLQNYFRNLPVEASGSLAWHTVDDCCSGLNMHNLYVAGRLMQNPALDARALLLEFAEGYFGKSAAPVLVRALEAIEYARCRSLRYSIEVGDPHEGLRDQTASQDALPSDWLKQAQAMTQSSLKELAGLNSPGGHQTAWPVTLDPEEFLPELVAHLKAIAQMLVFMQAANKVRRLLASAVNPDAMAAAMATLPEVVYDPQHTAGLERLAYEQHRQQLAATLQSPLITG